MLDICYWCNIIVIELVFFVIIIIIVVIVITIIIVTRPKLAYGGQGLAGVSFCASGAQLGRGK